MTNLLSIVLTSANCFLVSLDTNYPVYRVERSNDLVTWSVVASNWSLALYGPSFGLVDLETNSVRFFRAIPIIQPVSENLIAKKKPWWNDLWWWFRGVGKDDYRRRCGRCGRSGQAHYHVAGCRRFRNVTMEERLRERAART